MANEKYRACYYPVPAGVNQVINFKRAVVVLWYSANSFGHYAGNGGSSTWKLLVGNTGVPVSGDNYLIGQNMLAGVSVPFDDCIDYTGFELPAGNYTLQSSFLNAGGNMFVLEKIN